MKKINLKYGIVAIALAVVMSSCSAWSNQTNGTIIGSIGGAVVGASLGSAFGDRHSAHFGAQLGSQIGTVTGAAIGAEADAKARQRAYAQQQTKYQQEALESHVFVDDNDGKCYYRATDDNHVLFNSRDSQLTGSAKRSLNAIARKLKKMKGNIYVYGSTDNVESRDFSEQLSLERARVAAGYLVTCGINRKRIKVQGLGDSSPLADNSTMEGRAQNRSVEIYIEVK